MLLRHPWLAGGLFVGLLACWIPNGGWSQQQFRPLDGEEEGRNAEIAARFLSILEQNPRRGTALDRVYGHHVEFGTLDTFLDQLRHKTKQSPDDGTAWMLLGLFESHRGEAAKATDAFRNAERFRPDDGLASYYLAQSLLLSGEPDEAIAALERAIERNPPRGDLLEIFVQLGRIHQRAQRSDEALAVWQRLESLYPDDPRIQEQIAVTLVEEGQYALALPRYQKLAELVQDDYRRVVFQIEAAELKIREKHQQEGIDDLERTLANLNPEGWLYRDVRRRIENVYLRTSDQDGLVKYYEARIERHPEDVDAMARLAKFLASSGRVPEAMQWMQTALQRAPNRTELRLAFIGQLVDEQRYADAIAEYAQLAKSTPGNIDVLRDWGKLVLRDRSQGEAARKTEAARIWKQILALRPDDAVTMAQVADLFRQADMAAEAIAQYQRAIELAPEQPQYREYLGQYYHGLNRRDEALATWRSIAEGPRHNAGNVARLAEVYSTFGYDQQAAAQIATAVKLDFKDFHLALTAANYHARTEDFDEALRFMEAADQLADNDDECESVLTSRIEILQSAGLLDDEIERLATVIHSSSPANKNDWYLLARYFEADRRWQEATDAIDRAIVLDGTSIALRTTAARIAEHSGDLGHAADMNRQLATIDRRMRGDHLMNVARLESQLGRTEQALQAGRDLIASAPGNVEGYEFYAQLCFRLGEMEDGLATLRKAIRISPTEPHLTMALGSALAEQFRTDEAIEVYWRAFEHSDELDDKTTLTLKLADLYLQLNQFDQLIERLERERQDDSKRREMTICLAQAHHAWGDYGAARDELERLFHEESQDTNLLQQLSKLCEEGGDLDIAIDYQRRLAEISPGHETELRLAGLLQQRGDHEDARDILVRLARREEDPARLFRSLDSLLMHGNYDSVIAITDPSMAVRRDNWELLYREGVALASLDKRSEAEERFRQLLALPLPHETLGAAAAERLQQAQRSARTEQLRGSPTDIALKPSPWTYVALSAPVRMAVGLSPSGYDGSPYSRHARIWMPDNFGLARMASYGWLIRFQQDRRKAAEEDTARSASSPKALAESISDLRAAMDSGEPVDPARLYDRLYIESVQEHSDAIREIAKHIARAGGMEEQRFFLAALSLPGSESAHGAARHSDEALPRQTPMDDEELAFMLDCYRNVRAADQQQSTGAAVTGGPGSPLSSYPGAILASAHEFANSATILNTVVKNLELADRQEEARQLLDEAVSSATNDRHFSDLMRVFLAREDLDRLHRLYRRWIDGTRDAISKTPTVGGSAGPRQYQPGSIDFNIQVLLQWMGRYGPEEKHAEVLAILDPALDLSIQSARLRRAASSSRARSTSHPFHPFGARFVVFYGKTPLYPTIDFPRPNAQVDMSTLMLLRGAFEIFTRNDVITDFVDHLRSRVENSNPDDRPYNQLLLGYVLWWSDEREEALEVLTSASERFPDDATFQLEMGRLYDLLGDVDRALEVVDSIAFQDQRLLQQRELAAMQMAERLGDYERARKAVERLFGMRLDKDTQLTLVDAMRRLGMHELAEAVVSQVHRRAGNQVPALALLMTHYQATGQTELAREVAHTILRRTATQSKSAATLSYASSNATQHQALRQQALRFLHQTNSLTDLIAQLEKRLEQNRGSVSLYEQLIEYYRVIGAHDKIQSLLQKAIADNPDAIASRLQLAQHLLQNNQPSEACDQYLESLRRDC